MAAPEEGNRREQSYDVGNILSRVLFVRSDDDWAVVPRRKPAPAALPFAFAPRRPTRRGRRSWWRRNRLGHVVLQFRNYYGISGVVWRDRLPAHALLLAGGSRSVDAGYRRWSGGRDDRLLVRGQGVAQVLSLIHISEPTRPY